LERGGGAEASGARRSFKVANRKPDHDRLIAFLKGLSGRVLAAVEPTGDYHRPLAYRLLSEGIEVVSISSVALARVREARYGTWDKNDPKDAQVILSMLAQRMVQTYYDPLIAGTHDLQELANTYFQITLTRMRLQHSLLCITFRCTSLSSLGIGIRPGPSGLFVFSAGFRRLNPSACLISKPSVVRLGI
jgi:hypothetical protein